MSDQRKSEISRRVFLESSLGAVAAASFAVGCGGNDPSSAATGVGGSGNAGGTNSSGGTTNGTERGGSASGSNASSSGGTRIANGGNSTTGDTATSGGNSATGGSTTTTGGNSTTGGGLSTGGKASTGGTSATGGSGTAGTGGASTGNALVGLVRGSSISQATKDAIAIVGGFPNVSGKTVLLKPNVNTGDPSPYSTNPEIVRAIIELAKAGGASRIVVADRSYTPISTTTALAKSGITAVAKELGAETIDLDGSATTALKPTGATNWTATFRIYNIALTDSPVVINLCCCKNHNSSANFTASLKNWVGLLHTGDRNTAHGDIGNRIPELHLAVKESLIVMDATGVVLTLGPNPSTGGATASPGIVVATKDNVACDATCLAILKYYLKQASLANTNIDKCTCWNQPQMLRAIALGLGITGKSQYDYKQTGVAEMDALLTHINA